jgi:hypothetical protein
MLFATGTDSPVSADSSRCRLEPKVRGHYVAALKQHDVSRHDLLGRNHFDIAIPAHPARTFGKRRSAPIDRIALSSVVKPTAELIASTATIAAPFSPWHRRGMWFHPMNSTNGWKRSDGMCPGTRSARSTAAESRVVWQPAPRLLVSHKM